MKTLSFDQEANLGGVNCLYAIPKSSFVRIWRDYTNSLNYLRVKNREDIIDIYTNENSQFSETYEKMMYKPEFSGFVPKSNPLNEKQLRQLEVPANWLILFMDNNDNWRLAGNEDTLLTFSYTDATGPLSGVNQLSFTFSANARNKSVFIELAEIEDL